MKKLFLVLILAMTSITAYADIEGAPFMPESDKRFNAIEQGNHYKINSYPVGAADGHWARQLAMATYDFSSLGGSSTANPNGAGAGIYDLKIALPANAIITQTWLYSLTKPTTSASGTLAFYCQNASDILAATAAASYATAGASIDGSSTGAAAAFKYLTAACDIKAKIATGALTAGKVTAYVEYVVHQ